MIAATARRDNELLYLETPVGVNDGAEGEKRIGDGMIGYESNWNYAQSSNRHDPLPCPVLRRCHCPFSIEPTGWNGDKIKCNPSVSRGDSGHVGWIGTEFPNQKRWK